jgi:hypothetical protein
VGKLPLDGFEFVLKPIPCVDGSIVQLVEVGATTNIPPPRAKALQPSLLIWREHEPSDPIWSETFPQWSVSRPTFTLQLFCELAESALCGGFRGLLSSPPVTTFGHSATPGGSGSGYGPAQFDGSAGPAFVRLPD